MIPARPHIRAGTAEAGPLDDVQRARLSPLRGQITFASSRGNDAPPLLLTAARQLEPLDVRLARETYLEALSAAVFAGRLALGGGVREVAQYAAVATPQGARSCRLMRGQLGWRAFARQSAR